MSMLERKYRLVDMKRKFGVGANDKKIGELSDKMNKRVYGFADAGKKHRLFNEKELEVIRYIFSRLEADITLDDALNEALEVFYSASIIK